MSAWHSLHAGTQRWETGRNAAVGASRARW
jgi:hypothetical protein